MLNTAAFFSKLNQKLETELDRWELPGISYGVIKSGEIAAEGFAGKKKLGLSQQKELQEQGESRKQKGLSGQRELLKQKGLPEQEKSLEKPDRETLYQIGSVTKSFTAADLAILVQRKQLSFDDPVITYLPWFRLGDEETTKRVTVRDLLCHRTGMGRHDEEWIFSDYSRQELAELLGMWNPDWPLGTHWEYQNLCYVALGLVIESISGKSWEDFTRKELLEPLQMNHTGFFLEELAENPNHAEPYGRPVEGKNRGIVKVPYFLFPKENKKLGTYAPHGPAGSIYSNVADMEKWLQFQLGMHSKLYSEAKSEMKSEIKSGFQFDGTNVILRKDLLMEMHRPQMKMEDSLYLKCTEQQDYSYGLGWFRSRYRNVIMLDHGGNVPGYGCLAVLVPELELGITAHINLCDTTFAYALAYEITDYFLGISGGRWFEREYEYMETLQNRES